MNLKNPLGETVNAFGRTYTVIGVVKDMVMRSSYEPVKQTIFYIDKFDRVNYFNIKINPKISAGTALALIEPVFKKFDPENPFEYKFADDDFNAKFINEERVAKLAGFFAILAIFISCLGLLGLASFVAEQRTKEIGIRKVLGATVLNVWHLLSKDFVSLVIISLLVSVPISYYFMHNWLQNYEYRTEMSWWIFVAAGGGALSITLLTISFQAIKAAIANPVKSLRTE
jgi:ABC-type antimicrobial peptide transport system permease subunit